MSYITYGKWFEQIKNYYAVKGYAIESRGMHCFVVRATPSKRETYWAISTDISNLSSAFQLDIYMPIVSFEAPKTDEADISEMLQSYVNTMNTTDLSTDYDEYYKVGRMSYDVYDSRADVLNCSVNYNYSSLHFKELSIDNIVSTNNELFRCVNKMADNLIVKTRYDGLMRKIKANKHNLFNL